jgi:RNA polymerase primary sigma factor
MEFIGKIAGVSRDVMSGSYSISFTTSELPELPDKDTLLRVSAKQYRQKRSLDAPLGAKPNLNLLSVLVDGSSPLADGRTYSRNQEEQVERALRSLDEREDRVVTAYFGIGQEHQTMAEIAEDMHLKRERVRQIRDRAVRRLRQAYKRRLREL